MRFIPDWIHTYSEYTLGQESPKIFHLWSAIWALSVALGRKVWVSRGGYYTLYPNFYIVLVAGSATCKKSTAIKVARGFLGDLKPDSPFILPDNITPERMVQKVAQRTRSISVPTKDQGVPKKCPQPIAYCNIFTSELSGFLGDKKANHKMISVLTDLYDCPSYWSYDTILRKEDILENVFTSLMGATTIEWLKKSLSQNEMSGGFANRVIWVVKDWTDRKIAHPRIPTELIPLRKDLIQDLRDVQSMCGEFVETPAAYDWYEKWYHEFSDKYIKHAPAFLDGYLARRPDHLIKLALVLAVARGSNYEIDIRDFVLADKVLKQTEEDLPELFEEMIIRTSDNQRTRGILTLIKRHSPVEEQDLLRKSIDTGLIGDTHQFYKCINTFLVAKLVERVQTHAGKVSALRLLPGHKTKLARRGRPLKDEI